MSAPAALLHVFPSFEAGGAQVRAARLWPALGSAFRHLVCALDDRWEAAELFPEGFEIERIAPPGARGTLRTARFARRLLARLSPDALCTYNFGSLDAVLAARSLRLRRHVHHEDGFGPDEAERQKRRRVLLRRALLCGARAVVVPSHGLQRIALESWRVRPERVRLVPNGLDTAVFTPGEDAALRAQLGIPAQAFLVGCAGRLRREKNVPRLLRAAARAELADLHLLVIGDGDQRAAVEALAREGPLAGRVHLAGRQRELVRWFRAMDAFALTSDTEQMPMALLEAMACALPVVATDVGDVRAILPPAQAQLVVPLGPEVESELAAGLRRLASDAAFRGALGRSNRARVAAAFGFDTMVAAYREIYAAAATR